MSINILLIMKYTPEEDEDADTHDVSHESRSEQADTPHAPIILFFVFAVIFFWTQTQKYHRGAMYVAAILAILFIASVVIKKISAKRKN
jgi:hypothetical protein